MLRFISSCHDNCLDCLPLNAWMIFFSLSPLPVIPQLPLSISAATHWLRHQQLSVLTYSLVRFSFAFSAFFLPFVLHAFLHWCLEHCFRESASCGLPHYRLPVLHDFYFISLNVGIRWHQNIKAYSVSGSNLCCWRAPLPGLDKSLTCKEIPVGRLKYARTNASNISILPFISGIRKLGIKWQYVCQGFIQEVLMITWHLADAVFNLNL